jgi:hypothetical protein
MTGRRLYRRTLKNERLSSFTITVKETDLWIAVSSHAYDQNLVRDAETYTWRLRRSLELYLEKNPLLKECLKPCLHDPDAPHIVHTMVTAANKAGVGPMAAVAGAIAELVGRHLMRNVDEVIVENGGDIFIKAAQPVTVGIYAGKSQLSGRMALLLDPAKTPLGVCTSSGTVGPSLSFGCVDAAITVSPSTALADAAATALGNMVGNKEDLDLAIMEAAKIEGLSGALLVKEDKVAAWGDIELVRL